MADFLEIYTNHAEEYDYLVENEDYQNNLWKKLDEITGLNENQNSDSIIVEFGAGTGRLTKELIKRAKHVYAFDLSQHMLDKAFSNLNKSGKDNFTLQQADNTGVFPILDELADIAIEGWSFGHSIIENFDNYKEVADNLVKEMLRLLKPGGKAIIIETLGTCKTSPEAPDSRLKDFYDYLEHQHNFTYNWVRTDYRYPSQAEAEKSFGFFFGEEFVNYIKENNSNIIPECTGIWSLTK